MPRSVRRPQRGRGAPYPAEIARLSAAYPNQITTLTSEITKLNNAYANEARPLRNEIARLSNRISGLSAVRIVKLCKAALNMRFATTHK
jgi:hypothetical protein